MQAKAKRHAAPTSESHSQLANFASSAADPFHDRCRLLNEIEDRGYQAREAQRRSQPARSTSSMMQLQTTAKQCYQLALLQRFRMD